MAHFKQVMLYAVRGHFDHDILEHTDVTVKTTDKKEIFGNMYEVAASGIHIIQYNTEENIFIPYDEILSISDS